MTEHAKATPVDRPTPSRVSGAEALKAHVTLALGLLVCLAAFWFEVRRALGGNSLSWAYVFEWPLLGAFAVYMWWKVLHPSPNGEPKEKNANIAPEFDGMLAAWQAHQAELERAEESLKGSEPEKP